MASLAPAAQPQLVAASGSGGSPSPQSQHSFPFTEYRLTFRRRLIFRKRVETPFEFWAHSDENAIDIMFRYLKIFRGRNLFRFWLAGGKKLERIHDEKQIYPPLNKR